MNPEISPKEFRKLIRSREWTAPTTGAAKGYLQANLVMLPRDEAFNFFSNTVNSDLDAQTSDDYEVTPNPQSPPVLISGVTCPVIVFLKTDNSKKKWKMSPLCSTLTWCLFF